MALNLAGTTVLNGLSVVIKLATVLILNKVLAVFVGPTGYAVIGQFQNLVSMLSTFASGAINIGVTKATAEHAGQRARQEALWQTAFTLGLIGTVLCSAVLILFRGSIARWALGDIQHQDVLLWLAGSLGLMVVNSLLLAILNGLKAVGPFVVANIANSLIGAAVTMALVQEAGLTGALIAVAANQALACGITAWLFQRTVRIRWRHLLGPVNIPVARELGGYALMSLTSAIVIPASQFWIRDGLARQLGWHEAGLWQALWKISETHLLLLTTTLSVYFLPRFAEIRDPALLRTEVWRGYRFVLPLVSLSAALIFILRDWLIRTLLTPEFMPVADALGWQLAGDVLKIGSWVMAFTMVSHARTRTFIVSEITFAALLAISIPWLAGRFGLSGAAFGYALTYAIYWVTMAFIFRNLQQDLRSQNHTTA